MSNPVTISFNPNDFYYVNANFIDNDKSNPYTYEINTTYCDTKKTVNTKTRDECIALSSSTDTDYNNCYNAELCKNIEDAKQLYDAQNKHDGANNRYTDTNLQYTSEILKTYNLGIGVFIVCATGIFFYVKKYIVTNP